MELISVSPTATAPSENFTGAVYVNPIYQGTGESRMIVSLVRFTPGPTRTGTRTRSARPCTAPTGSASW